MCGQKKLKKVCQKIRKKLFPKIKIKSQKNCKKNSKYLPGKNLLKRLYENVCQKSIKAKNYFFNVKTIL